jgi:hypothetical protein
VENEKSPKLWPVRVAGIVEEHANLVHIYIEGRAIIKYIEFTGVGRGGGKKSVLPTSKCRTFNLARAYNESRFERQSTSCRAKTHLKKHLAKNIS